MISVLQYLLFFHRIYTKFISHDVHHILQPASLSLCPTRSECSGSRETANLVKTKLMHDTTVNLFVAVFPGQNKLSDCNTVIWNGPMGVFEFEAFAKVYE